MTANNNNDFTKASGQFIPINITPASQYVYAIYKYNNSNKVTIPLTSTLEVACFPKMCYIKKTVNDSLVSNIINTIKPYCVTYLYDIRENITSIYCDNQIILSLKITPIISSIRTLKENYLFRLDKKLSDDNFTYAINTLNAITINENTTFLSKQQIIDSILNNEEVTIYIYSLNESQFKLSFNKYSFYSSAQSIDSKKFANNNITLTIKDNKVYVNDSSNGVSVDINSIQITGSIESILCSLEASHVN